MSVYQVKIMGCKFVFEEKILGVFNCKALNSEFKKSFQFKTY